MYIRLCTAALCSFLCQVLEATNSLRDALCARMGPVYGITTLHASLKVFHAEKPSPTADEVVKAQSYAFGLMALGKLILRVPAEIVEEELPRLKSTLIEVSNATGILPTSAY